MGTDEALVRRLAALHGRPPRTVRLLGAGADHRAYELDGRLVVRIAVVPEPQRTAREARLLELIRTVTRVPVPQPVWAEPDAGAIAYPLLPGAPLPALRREIGVALAPALGELLAALHELAPGDVPLDFDPPAQWLADATGCYARASVPPARRAAIEQFLAAAPPRAAPAACFSHNDLGAEHVLAHAGRIGGVIDWDDAALCDPAYDLGLLLRDLGPGGLDGALRGYGSEPPGLRERARFYARCAALEDLAGPAPARGLDALPRLFDE